MPLLSIAMSTEINMDTPHFYAISRRDLPTHQQAIQSAHAQLEFVRQGGDSPGEHPPFVWLTVEDKWELLQLATVIRSHGINVQEFHDPDYKGYDPSAIACLVNEEKRYLLSHLPLWKCGDPHKVGWFEGIHRTLKGN
jgi:hypothetical protein